MSPPAVFALPFFQLLFMVSAVWRLTHIAVALAHCLFNVPLAVWISGFMRGVPAKSTKPPISTAIPFRSSSSGSSCR
ncbi:hypothetical protein PE067_00890 [Paracoccus sp. DMF-8]|nr:hypothetical protein [Paracoccus sp. DMF-8]MDF3604841.1 hypothetical protein [Paracoccus sp. DMF-8]